MYALLFIFISQTSVIGESAWEFSKIRNASYLHNYLQEMPQLNLRNKEVRGKLLVSLY